MPLSDATQISLQISAKISKLSIGTSTLIRWAHFLLLPYMCAFLSSQTGLFALHNHILFISELQAFVIASLWSTYHLLNLILAELLIFKLCSKLMWGCWPESLANILFLPTRKPLLQPKWSIRLPIAIQCISLPLWLCSWCFSVLESCGGAKRVYQVINQEVSGYSKEIHSWEN